MDQYKKRSKEADEEKRLRRIKMEKERDKEIKRAR